MASRGPLSISVTRTTTIIIIYRPITTINILIARTDDHTHYITFFIFFIKPLGNMSTEGQKIIIVIEIDRRVIDDTFRFSCN